VHLVQPDHVYRMREGHEFQVPGAFTFPLGLGKQGMKSSLTCTSFAAAATRPDQRMDVGAADLRDALKLPGSQCILHGVGVDAEDVLIGATALKCTKVHPACTPMQWCMLPT
jgi:hypothetical protein